MTWTPSRVVEPAAPTEVFRGSGQRGNPMPDMRAPWPQGAAAPDGPPDMAPTRAPWADANDDPMVPTKAPWAK